MWHGNLVTMPWWDDIWLNESFATWMGNKVIRAQYPGHAADVAMLESVQRAMVSDSLVNAQEIRQPIPTSMDLGNGDSAITYSKGGGVLEMFERWMGLETFQRGIRQHMTRFRFGTATIDDLLQSLSQASGRDVATPFRTFLVQSGVPMLQMRVTCEGDERQLHVAQSRYLPVGSTGSRERTWQIPLCIRYESSGEIRQTCTLLDDAAESTVPLEGDACPTWVMPNANAAGYFRFSMPQADLDRLRRHGWRHLTPREKLAYASNLTAAFASAATPAGEILSRMEGLATGENRSVATAPMELFIFARDHAANAQDRARVEAAGRRLYAPVLRRLSWRARRNDTPETRLLRAQVIGFLALHMQDGATRRNANRRGRAYVGFGTDGALHPEAVETNLADTALAVAVQEGDASLFDGVLGLLATTEDATVRTRILAALGHTRDPALAARARALALDARLRGNEIRGLLRPQFAMAETREAAWQWLRETYEALEPRMHPGHYAGMPGLTAGFCAEARAAEVQAFFEPHMRRLHMGEHNLTGVLERIRLCDARASAHRDALQQYFARR